MKAKLDLLKLKQVYSEVFLHVFVNASFYINNGHSLLECRRQY